MPDDRDAIDASALTAASTLTPVPSGAPPALDVVAERYEIRALLGVGGMGRVYRAHDRALDETVALKVLRRELVDAEGVLERFRQEVRLARRVTSPHVVRTFDLGQHGDEHFLTMEYVEGRSLAQLLEQAQLPQDEVVRIARGVAAGIAAAHGAGVLHRDLKPDNVLVARDGRIAITDFGIARTSAAPTETIDRFVGTPAYMAPEQVASAGAIGPPTDVYAFGAILYELLVGRRPFSGATVIELAMARLIEPVPDPRALRPVPDSLAELAMRCMARDPDARPRDGGALVAALATLDLATRASTLPALAPVVPMQSSRAVALLPLRATGDLVEIADGLAEEIVDALSMTRDLRVRPLASVRGQLRDGADPRDVGKALGVDVVVEGSLRRVGTLVRITARVIGVDDGFQLWANRFDTTSDGLLAVGDDIARAVAAALTADLELAPAPHRDAQATERYLEGKAKLRLGWRDAALDGAIADLEAARALTPDGAAILAALAMARARTAFLGRSPGSIHAARELAERAVSLEPTSGEAWLALAHSRLYSGQAPEAAFAVCRAVVRAPGVAAAQSLLGGMLLEAGDVDDAVAHLEAAFALDPMTEAQWDLARAHAYAGRFALAIERLRTSPHARYYTATQLARFHAWQGLRWESELPPRPATASPLLVKYADVMMTTVRTGRYDSAVRDLDDVPSPRLRSALGQSVAEAAMFGGEHELALGFVRSCVDSGLQDLLWIERCPLLVPLHGDPRYQALAAVVRARAQAVLSSVRAGLQSR